MMNLLSFQVFNYKSIIDSKECYLSPSDGITIIAGQNESGKSSLLQALFDSEEGAFREDSHRDNEPPEVPAVERLYGIDSPSMMEFRVKHLFDKGFRNDFVLHFFLSIDKIRVRAEGENDGVHRSVCGQSLIALEQWFSTLRSIDISDDEVVKKAFKGIKLSEANRGANKEFVDLYTTIEDISHDLALQVQKVTPSILMFDDFCDLLPDSILISELKSKSSKVKGYQAVKNIEKILDVDLLEVDSLADSKRMQRQDAFKKSITAQFNQRWKQRIGAENGAVIHVMHFQGGTASGPYFKFFIETKEGELLEPYKRSQGFKWFLSFYLHLVAEDKRKGGIIILFDEPGLHLHSKAQADMLAVFEELSDKNQILYSTHSPYLIKSDRLHRVRLIINTNEGTKVEKLTTNAGGKTHDALKPIIDAIGLDMRNSFTPSMGGKNVIVEGVSDFYYFNAFKHLLEINDPIYFLPAMGAPNAHLLMELCMGWGLDWKMIFDEKGTKPEIAAIKKKFFPVKEEFDQNVYLLKKMDGIEDMFSLSDFQLVAPDMTKGENETLGKVVGKHGGKELVARLFSDKAFGGDIILNLLADSTIANFRAVFSFILGT
jgi:predicted ATPase